jgi:hypothetical protein
LIVLAVCRRWSDSSCILGGVICWAWFKRLLVRWRALILTRKALVYTGDSEYIKTPACEFLNSRRGSIKYTIFAALAGTALDDL